jgi:hypothetical protein
MAVRAEREPDVWNGPSKGDSGELVMPRPDATEYAPFYGTYLANVPEEEILPVMADQLERTLALLRDVPEETACLRHPPYTWSVKEVIGHLADSERVFGYRALRIARGDTTPLAGFDENDYARAAAFDRIPFNDLLTEFAAVRRSHLLLFRHLPEAAWERRGTANNNPVSVRALAYIIVGHERRHTAILRKRLSSS